MCAMGKRGENNFKRNDAVRALQSCRDGGLEPAMMEVVLGPETVTFRVYGDKAMPTQGSADGTANPWDTVLKGDGDAPKQKRTA
jgi:hypothetical protein